MKWLRLMSVAAIAMSCLATTAWLDRRSDDPAPSSCAIPSTRTAVRTLEPPFDGSHLCGVDCLKFIADAIGSKSIGSNYESLVKLTGVGMHGSSLQGLAVAAECIGMRTKTIDISNLRRLPSPLIAKVRQEHFIAVLTQDGEDIVLFDPSQGLLRVPFDDVRARFAGPALHLMECPNGAKSP